MSGAARRRRWTSGQRRPRGERGSVTIELTLLVPALVLVLGLLVAGGRLWFARTTVAEAAQTGARAASLARTASTAATEGRDAAQASLATAGLRCDQTAVEIRTAAFAVAVGTPATVGSTVRCRVPLADVALPGMPGSVLLTGTGAAALDTYRSR